MIEENDRLKVPKRLYIMDYQLEPCEIDGISDARLNAFPFNTTNGKLVEYLCLDTLWHPASEEPKKDMLVLTDTQSIMNKGNICWMTVKLTDNGFIHNWSNYVKATKITRWLYIDDLFPKEGGGEQ